MLTYGKQIYWCNANASKLKFTLRWCFWTRTVERSCGKGEIYDLNMSTRARFRCLSFFSLVLIALNRLKSSSCWSVGWAPRVVYDVPEMSNNCCLYHFIRFYFAVLFTANLSCLQAISVSRMFLKPHLGFNHTPNSPKLSHRQLDCPRIFSLYVYSSIKHTPCDNTPALNFNQNYNSIEIAQYTLRTCRWAIGSHNMAAWYN